MNQNSDFELEEVLAYIEDADALEIDPILNAITRRYCRLFPDWDILFLSLPREPEQRKHQLEQMLEHIKADVMI